MTTNDRQTKDDEMGQEERKKWSRKSKLSSQELDEAIYKFRSLYNKELGRIRKDRPFFSDWTEDNISVPRYAWQWNFTKDEYEKIKKHICDYKDHLREIATTNTVCCKLIQLYVSEWYKREFNGNTKTGNALTSIEAGITPKDICKVLGIDESNVYTSQSPGVKPTAEWLKTIYVDGGLPLNYLQNKDKKSSLKKSIVEIIDKGTSDLGTLCNDQVVNQSYNAHRENEPEASIYDFVETVILGDDFIIEGFEQFEDIIREVKKNLKPKFYFECVMSQVDDVWYRTFNLRLKKGSSLETTNYFDYSRVKDWMSDTDIKIREASWCDILIYTRQHPDTPIRSLKAINNFAGKFFIPNNNSQTSICITGDDTIGCLKILFEGMTKPIDLKTSEYDVAEFSRVQLDEVQPGYWVPHKDKCGLKSAVFYYDTDEYSYEIDENCFYHDTEIKINTYGSDPIKMHKIDVFGLLKFKDGKEYHSAVCFDIKPSDKICRLISFKGGNKVTVIDQYGNESESILLVIDNSKPKDCYSIYSFGEKEEKWELKGFFLQNTHPYRTNLVISGEDKEYDLGPAVIIPKTDTSPIIVKGTHDIRINCTCNGKPEVLSITNSEKDYFDYSLLLSDGSKVHLSLIPPYQSYDIIRRSPEKKLLNTFNIIDNATDKDYLEVIREESQNLSFCFNMPSKESAKSFYIRKRNRKKDIEWMPFTRRTFFPRDNIKKSGAIEDARFLVDPELEILNNGQWQSLTCENCGATFFRFTEDAKNCLIKHSNNKLRQKPEVDHLQVFTEIHIKGKDITLTMLK